jgi:plastocyanin
MRVIFGLIGVTLFLALAAGAAAISLPPVSFHGGNLTCAFAEIRIVNGTFEPPTVYVYKNATVVWVNPGPGEHAIGIGDEVSPPLLAGDSYTINFHEFGEYNYSCSYHPGERGRVIVR